jgi:hypothetical protein
MSVCSMLTIESQNSIWNSCRVHRKGGNVTSDDSMCRARRLDSEAQEDMLHHETLRPVDPQESAISSVSLLLLDG